MKVIGLRHDAVTRIATAVLELIYDEYIESIEDEGTFSYYVTGILMANYRTGTNGVVSELTSLIGLHEPYPEKYFSFMFNIADMQNCCDFLFIKDVLIDIENTYDIFNVKADMETKTMRVYVKDKE